MAAAQTRHLRFGDVDPLSVVVAVLSLGVAIFSAVVAVRAWRWQQADPVALAERLATAVRRQEQEARRQLLGDPGRAIDVAFDFRPAPAHNAAEASRQGRLAEVAAYYRRLRPRRMVITGAPGAGKTVLAVELIMALLEDRAPADPVPMRLSAASLDLGADTPVERWLVTHLVDVYEMPPRSAQALVDAGRILPVVDGLDELDATDSPGFGSRAGQAMRAFNAYQRYRGRAELIVTCRSEHYAALTGDLAWVEDAAMVEIRPVSAAQAREFITARAVDARRWDKVLDLVRRDRRGRLAAALATPWRLTLATIVYEQRDAAGGFLRDPDELADPVLDTADAVRDHLLGLFLPAALAAQPYHPAQAHRWLAVLAGYLDRNAVTGRSLGGRELSGTDIVPHELWPLAGSRRPRVLTLAIFVLIWLAASAILLAPVLIGVTAASVTRLLLSGPGIMFALPGVLGAVLLVAAAAGKSWSTVWPAPHRVSFGQFRTPRGRRQLAEGVPLGLAAGVVAGVAFGALSGPAVAVAAGLAVAVAVGLAAGLTSELAEDPGAGSADPRSIIRHDLLFGLLAGLPAGLAVALAAGAVSGLAFGAPFGLAGGLAFGVAAAAAVGLTGGLTSGLTGGLLTIRYLALLLCAPLPWRLGRFLTACYQAGVVRIAGAGYQFRHRELQDYLTRHRVPVTPAGADPGGQTGLG